MEGDLIHIRKWLVPFSWLYGAVINLRNELFDMGVLKTKQYDIPVINVGNITVGGTGKTPHIEYLIHLLKDRYKVAVLSRGYKRKSHGFILADSETAMKRIGDEAWQIKQKFPDIHVAVDANRCHGIETLQTLEQSKDTDVILLDDAYQHRYVTPGINILLIDYHHIVTKDYLLPAGRLREHVSAIKRSNIVIVSKCPHDITPMGFRVIIQSLRVRPYQQLFFSSLNYGDLTSLFGTDTLKLNTLRGHDMHVLLLTGIGNPEQMEQDIQCYVQHLCHLSFPDHHYYRKQDIERINRTFESMPRPRIVITTEKDATRLLHAEGLLTSVKERVYVLPVKIGIMRNQETEFNKKILDYVHKNS